jgi:hypothetical protein
VSYGELVPGVDCDVLLRAIAIVETNGGVNNWPRIEASFIPSGKAFTVQGHVIVGTGRNVNAVVTPRWAQWGLASAASWGWWQILYHTAADMGYAGPPHELHDPATCEPYVVNRLRRIAMTGATTVRDFADAWNSGTWKDANLVPDYTAAVEAAYQKITT